MVEKEKISTLHIEWFGGEPFMGYKNVILPISHFAKKICEKNNIQFYNTATTNGFFITQDKYNSMKEICMKGFQITLDGERELHNKVKFTENCASAFDAVLNNIKGYLEFNNEATLKLRINYTHDNLTPKIVEQVMEVLPYNIRDRIQIILKKVCQEKTDKSFYDKTLDIQKGFTRNGFHVNELEIITDFISCYAGRKYYTAINYDGTLIKCTASDDLYSKNPLGIIENDGSLTWYDRIDTKYQEATFENERCLKCKYLPICMGLCPRDHVKNYNGCKMDGLDLKIEEGIINFINESYRNRR